MADACEPRRLQRIISPTTRRQPQRREAARRARIRTRRATTRTPRSRRASHSLDDARSTAGVQRGQNRRAGTGAASVGEKRRDRRDGARGRHRTPAAGSTSSPTIRPAMGPRTPRRAARGSGPTTSGDQRRPRRSRGWAGRTIVSVRVRHARALDRAVVVGRRRRAASCTATRPPRCRAGSGARQHKRVVSIAVAYNEHNAPAAQASTGRRRSAWPPRARLPATSRPAVAGALERRVGQRCLAARHALASPKPEPRITRPSRGRGALPRMRRERIDKAPPRRRMFFGGDHRLAKETALGLVARKASRQPAHGRVAGDHLARRLAPVRELTCSHADLAR